MADVNYRTGNTNTARYTLAVNRRFSKDNEADFPQCVAFGKAADFAEKYFKKGTKVAISGRLQTGSYTNRDGVKVYTTEVVIEEQEFAESKSASSGNDSTPSAPASSPVSNPVVPGVNEFMSIPDGISEEELPFS